MALTQHLYKETYIGSGKCIGTLSTLDGKKINIDFSRVSGIDEEIIYWTNADYIHKWFIKNRQANKQPKTYCDTNDLKLLLDTCKQVKADKKLGKKLLPTDYGYNKYYIQDISKTIDSIESLLNEEGIHDDNNCWFYYLYCD